MPVAGTRHAWLAPPLYAQGITWAPLVGAPPCTSSTRLVVAYLNFSFVESRVDTSPEMRPPRNT